LGQLWAHCGPVQSELSHSAPDVTSLVDKMDELGALMRTQQEYQEETWLQEQL